MQKLSELIGVGKRGNGTRTLSYDVAYAWHANKLAGGSSFSLSISDTCLAALRFLEDDRCDIFLDLENKNGMVTLCKTGDYALSKNGSRRVIKISSLEPCEALAKIFPRQGQQIVLERIAIHGRSITFRLP
jgi:hypothetical protein